MVPSSAAAAAKATPTPATINNRVANDLPPGVKPDDPEVKSAVDDAAARSPAENRDALGTGKDNTIPEANVDDAGKVGAQKPEDTQKLKEQNTKQEQSIKDKMKTPAGIAIIAALGLTLALVLKFIIKGALEAKKCTDCRDYKITVKSIKPAPVETPVIGSFFGLIKPSSIEVAWSAPTDYEPLEGKESFTFKDTGFAELDGQTFTVDKLVSKGVVRMGMNMDTTDFKGSKGSIQPNCADFNARFNDQVNQAGQAAGDFLGSFLKGASQNMGTLFLVIGVCVLLYVAIKFFGSQGSSS